jgi:hypothetical protein
VGETFSYDINNSNQVAGEYTDTSGNAHGFTATVGLPPALTLEYVAPARFDGMGPGEIVFQNGGKAVIWAHTGNALGQVTVPDASMGSEWAAFGTGNFSGSGRTDIVWQATISGQREVAIWQMNGAYLNNSTIPAGHMGTAWQLATLGDFDGNGFSDLFWVSNGNATIWEMAGTTLLGTTAPAGHMGSEWSVASSGDFNGNGTDDVLWVSNTGNAAIWMMSNGQLSGFNGNVGQMGSAWHVVGAGDVFGDGTDAIVWVDTSNDVQVWRMSGQNIAQIVNPSGHNGSEWHLEGLQNFSGNGKADLLWLTSTGGAQVWELTGNQVAATVFTTPQNETIIGL